METHYDVLGVNREGSEREIRQAFELQQKQCSGGSETAKRISAAYLTLSDPDRRREYDESLNRVLKANLQPAGGEPGAAVFATDLSEHPGSWTEAAYVASPQHKRQPHNMRGPEPAPYDTGLWKKAWRGEHPLWVAFWGFWVLGGLLFTGVSEILILADTHSDSSQAFIRALVVFACVALAYHVFASVAIWRSAGRPETHPFWRVVARAIVLLPVAMAALGILLAVLAPIFMSSPEGTRYSAEQSSSEAYQSQPPASRTPPTTFTVDADLEQAAVYAIERYPFLDSDSPLANHAAIDEVVALRDQFYSEGYSIGTALRMAVEVVGPRHAQRRSR